MMVTLKQADAEFNVTCPWDIFVLILFYVILATLFRDFEK